MDLGGTVTYNGLSLNTVTRQAGGLPMSGYAVERFRPDPPPPTSYLEKRAISDGLDAGDVFLGGRSFALVVTAYGTSEGDFWDKAQDLVTGFTPTVAYAADSANRGFLALDFYQPTADVATWPTSAYPDGIPMRYYVRPQASPTYMVERDKDGGTASDPRSKTFDINLVARDPRKYLQSQTTATITTSTQTVTYKGDYPTPAIITFSLSATGNSAFTLTLGGLAVVINLSSQSSGSFTFDYGLKFLYATSGGASKMDLISSVAGYSSVDTGTTFIMSNSTGISTPVLTYRTAFG